MPCRQYVASGVHVGMCRVAASNALKSGLGGATLLCHMPTGRTGPAGVPWIDRHHDPAAPCLLVLKLSAELEPFLIENGTVQSRLGAGVSARLLDGSRR